LIRRNDKTLKWLQTASDIGPVLAIDVGYTDKTDSVPVGNPDPVLLRNPKVFCDNGDGNEY
jgi:hypothetical protein